MGKGKRIAILLLTTVMLMSWLPLIISANGPVPAQWYTIFIENLPKNTTYVDMLIYLPKADPMYTEPAEHDLPEEFSITSEIVTYCEDDYRSYTFHYRDALSDITPDKMRYSSEYVSFFFDNSEVRSGENVRYGHMEDIEARGDIRLAFLDREGNILKISPLLPTQTKRYLAYTTGGFTYNAATDVWEIDEYVSGIAVIIACSLSLFGIIVTCVVEWLVAIAFRLGVEYESVVRRTNLCSQILMRLSYVLLYSVIFWKYTYTVIILEIAVYLCEFLYYDRIMWDVSRKKVLLYTITANTVSLLIGLFTDRILLFG